MVSEAFSAAAQRVRLAVASPDHLVPRHDDSVYFTSAAICRFKQELLEAKRPTPAFVEQWCFRARNLEKLRRGEPPEWCSVFRQFGTFGAPEDLSTLATTFAHTLRQLAVRAGARLGAKVASHDHDLLLVLGSVIENIQIDTEAPSYYRHSYGHSRLAGRNANFTVQCAGGRVRDIGNVVVIRRDERDFALELAFGIETVATSLSGKESSLLASPVFAEQLIGSGAISLATMDLASTIAHLNLHGIRPFSSRRGRIFRSFARAFSEACARECVDHHAVLTAVHRALRPWYGDQPTRCQQLVEYISDLLDLQPLTPAAGNARLARRWAEIWV